MTYDRDRTLNELHTDPFELNISQTTASGPFICNLEFNATTLGDLITANFTCNRPFIQQRYVSDLCTGSGHGNIVCVCPL